MRLTPFLPLVLALSTIAGLQGQTPLLVGNSTLQFTAQAGGAAPPMQLVAVDGPQGGTYAVSQGTQPWLLTRARTGRYPDKIEVNINAAGLAAGNYQGTFTIFSAVPATTATVFVNLTVSAAPTAEVSPSTLTFDYQTGATPPAEKRITVSGPAVSFTATATTVSGGPWLRITPDSGQTNASIGVSVDPRGLTPGSYSGTVRVTSGSGPTASTSTTTVTLNVQSTPFLISDPAALNIAVQTGQPARVRTLRIRSSDNSAVNYSTALPPGVTWFNARVLGSPTPGTVEVSVDPATAPAGSYASTLGLFAFGGSGLQVPITAQVANGPVLEVTDPGATLPCPATTPDCNIVQSLSFNYRIGSGLPADRTLAVRAIDGSAVQFSPVVFTTPSDGTSWLVAGPLPATTPGNVTVGVRPDNLLPGVYTSTLRIVPVPGTTPLGQNTVIVPVTLTVTANPELTTDTPSLAFRFQKGAPSIAPVRVRIQSLAAQVALTSDVTYSQNVAPWLSVAAPDATDGEMTVSVVDAAALALPNGTYNATITVGPRSTTTPTGITPVQIPVELIVTNGRLVRVAPQGLFFTATAGGSSPAGQTISLSSSDGTTIPVTIADVITRGGGGWLSAVSSGSSPGSVFVSVATTQLIAGRYSGQFKVVSSAPGDPPVPVEVTLVVQPALNVLSDRSTVNFNYVIGQTVPASVPVSISSVPATVDVFPSVSTQIGGNWLVVTPAGGPTPRVFNIGINPTGLGIGNYVGEVALLTLQPGLTPVRIRVSLTVTSTAPAPVLAADPTSLEFDYTTGAAAPSARTFSIGTDQTAVSTATTAVSTSDGRPWLTATPSATFPRVWTVTVNPAGLNPGVYTGSITVQPLVGYGATVVPVRLTVRSSSGTVSYGVIGQIADGGTWQTSFTLTNKGTVAAQYTLRFWASNGSALALPVQGRTGRVTSIEGTILPGNTGTIVTGGLPEDATVVGWAELSSDGSVDGFAVFRQRVAGRADQEATVLLTRPSDRFLMAFDNTAGYTTGMTLVNTNATPLSGVTIRFRDEGGNILSTTTASLNPRGHSAFVLTDVLPATANRRGLIEVIGTAMTGLGLRFTAAGSFTTLPILLP